MSGIVICIGQSASGSIVVNFLQNKLPVKLIIIEQKESRGLFIKRRIKRYGYSKVFGQLLFMFIVPRLLKKKANLRITQLLEDKQVNGSLDSVSIPIKAVKSVNSEYTRTQLTKLNPDLILVVGTRIIGRKTLNTHKGPWINIHAGITPLFRGVHGGYWSRVTNRQFGTTVHLIDEGIDTGQVLLQKKLKFTKDDNFLTYPFIQILGILDDLAIVLKKMMEGEKISEKAMYRESKLWTHPTIFQYFYNLIFRKIK